MESKFWLEDVSCLTVIIDISCWSSWDIWAIEIYCG